MASVTGRNRAGIENPSTGNLSRIDGFTDFGGKVSRASRVGDLVGMDFPVFHRHEHSRSFLAGGTPTPGTRPEDLAAINLVPPLGSERSYMKNFKTYVAGAVLTLLVLTVGVGRSFADGGRDQEQSQWVKTFYVWAGD